MTVGEEIKKNQGILSKQLRIANNGKCVNSDWIADWLAEKDQECCQCSVSCKINVVWRGWGYIVTKDELYRILTKQNLK